MNTTEMRFWLQGKIVPNWHTQDYVNLKFNRAKKAFDKSHHWQSAGCYSTTQPQWLSNLIPQFNFTVKSWNINCIQPNTIIQPNKKRISPAENLLKITIFLDDWTSGNYYECHEQAFTNWSAGSFIGFPADWDCLDINLGSKSRYTVELIAEL